MIKNRNAISSVKLSKRSIRPMSAVTSTSKNPKAPMQIHQIITSLQQNIKELKTHYKRKEDSLRTTISNEKNKTGFRVGKVLHRNRSQSNFKKPEIEKNDEKSLMDIFQIRSYFLKLNGRETNNIVELYEFYKKNIQKRQKSTRILASVDMSNPNMGLSLEVGKESMLKQEHLICKEESKRQEKQSSKIQQKLESSSKFSVSGKMNNSSTFHKGSKKIDKPSHLASQLMSKNLYNFNNIANLMSNKKYKLTKDKEESFRNASQQREKMSSAKLHLSKQNNVNLINSMHQKTEDQIMKEVKEMKQAMITKNASKSPSALMESKREIEEQVSFKIKSLQQNEALNPPINQLQTEKKQQKEEMKSFQVSSIKKQPKQIMRIQKILELQQSPIVGSKTKDFSKSKYYVQPIPMAKKEKNIQQESISLQSNSRIIDLQLLPFDL